MSMRETTIWQSVKPFSLKLSRKSKEITGLCPFLSHDHACCRYYPQRVPLQRNEAVIKASFISLEHSLGILSISTVFNDGPLFIWQIILLFGEINMQQILWKIKTAKKILLINFCRILNYYRVRFEIGLISMVCSIISNREGNK